MNKISEEIKLLNNKYFNRIKKILNKNSYLFTNFIEATPKQDMQEGFDSIFIFPDVKIPIRIRKYYHFKYRDITIRSKSKNGFETEFDKICRGLGDYYFFAWENEERNNFVCYLIFDIKKFVSSNLVYHPDTPNLKNKDGTEFHSWNLDTMIRKNIIIIYELL